MLVVEIPCGCIVTTRLDPNALCPGHGGRGLQPPKDLAPDALTLAAWTNRKQHQVSVFVPILHDAEGEEADGEVTGRSK